MINILYMNRFGICIKNREMPSYLSEWVTIDFVFGKGS